MLLLTIFSLVLRVSGARRSTAAAASGETAARVLVFHHEADGACEDLLITAAGNAVFSNCGQGPERQSSLSASERARLEAWIGTYGPVNYDHSDPGPGGSAKTRLYLNGQGSQQATDADLQQLIAFAETLMAKTGSQP